MIAGYWMVGFHLVPSPPSVCPLPPALKLAFRCPFCALSLVFIVSLQNREGTLFYFPGPGIHSLLYASFPQRIIMFWNWKWPQMGKTGKVQIFTEPLMCARPWTRAFFFFFAFNPHNKSVKQIVLHLILQMRKLRSREVKRQVQGCTEWLLTKELPFPLLQAHPASMPQLVFEDFLGCFKLERYTSYRKQETKKSITFFVFWNRRQLS